MWKVFLIVCTLLVCCCCDGDNELQEVEARAKKKNTIRIWAMILLFVISKVAIFKVASVVIFMTIFQKIIYIAGLLINFFMQNQKVEKPPAMYGPPVGPPVGPPSEYNTVGYSYGPPEPNTAFPTQDYGLPSLTDVSENFNSWLINKP